MNSLYRITSIEEYQEQYKLSVENPEAFWSGIADHYQWKQKWDTTLEWEFKTPSVKWFKGGQLNITENCLDRHLKDRGNKLAIIWEPNDPRERAVRLTYRELFEEVCQYANILKRHGVKKGDRVALYMPMIPDLGIAVLACARIGAVHSVVFAGFSAHALADRINDAQCKMVLTSDGLFRGTKEIPVKAVVDEALKTCPSVRKGPGVKTNGLECANERGARYLAA